MDFIQDVYAAAKGKQSTSFLALYDTEELEDLSWVGIYAKLEKVIG